MEAFSIIPQGVGTVAELHIAILSFNQFVANADKCMLLDTWPARHLFPRIEGGLREVFSMDINTCEVAMHNKVGAPQACRAISSMSMAMLPPLASSPSKRDPQRSVVRGGLLRR